jgi:amino acid transporter
MERAGAAAPMSFLLAGLCAEMTGLCDAKLAGRLPEAAFGAAYVRDGFNSDIMGLRASRAHCLGFIVVLRALSSVSE